MRTLRAPCSLIVRRLPTVSSFPANSRCASVHKGHRHAARGQRSVARIALSACKDHPFSARLMPLTVLGANAHGPPDSDKRMCAQR